jgi:hypothetical protein
MFDMSWFVGPLAGLVLGAALVLGCWNLFKGVIE